MKCRPGDLAFVINEDPGCESNIGRIVKVLRRATGLSEYGDWDIEPISPDHLVYIPDENRIARYCEVDWAWLVAFDVDLQPIRDPGEDAVDETLLWVTADKRAAQGVSA